MSMHWKLLWISSLLWWLDYTSLTQQSCPGVQSIGGGGGGGGICPSPCSSVANLDIAMAMMAEHQCFFSCRCIAGIVSRIRIPNKILSHFIQFGYMTLMVIFFCLSCSGRGLELCHTNDVVGGISWQKWTLDTIMLPQWSWH